MHRPRGCGRLNEGGLDVLHEPLRVRDVLARPAQGVRLR